MDSFKLYNFQADFADLSPKYSEILRYMGCKEDSEEIKSIVYECLKEISGVIKPKACYMLFEIEKNEEEEFVDFGIFNLKSKYLSKNLSKSEQCFIIGATIGHGIDRLILKYSKISPAKALCLQSIGTELIEDFCDLLEGFIKKQIGKNLRPRFSPGYGDVDLSFQNTIFSVLQLEKSAGITLTDSNIMRPSKSVTAFIGVGNDECLEDKCLLCDKNNCEYRKMQQN